MHFKSIPLLEQKELNVDRENSIIKNICIANHGENKNGSYFSESFLVDLTNNGNDQNQGVKCRFGHPNMCATSLGTYVGRYKNFRYKNNSVFADLHLDDISKKTQVEGKGISMHEYIMDMAESNSDMFGNSIVISCSFEEEFDSDGNVIHDWSVKLDSFIASDLVDDPAATDSLFATKDMGVIMTEFLDENPEIFETVKNRPELIEDFFERYSNYQKLFKTKIDMSFLDKLKKKFGHKDQFDIEETLADGTIITIKTEGETPQVGDSVVDEEGKAVPDGEHVTKDGSTLVTENGNITEIREEGGEGDEEEGDGDGEPTMGEVMQSLNSLTESFNQFKTQYTEDLKESQAATELVYDELYKKFNNLAKTVKSKDPKDYTGNGKGRKTKMSESGYDPDAVREAREARKNKK